MHVVLLEEGWAQTVEVARTLEQAGHAVTVVTANGRTATYRRRTVAWRCGPALADAAALVDYLDQLAPFDRIVPLSEAAMAALWDRAPAWSDRIFPQTAAWQRALVRSKHRLVEHMAARGIATPRQHAIDAAFDAVRTVRELGLPLVVKEATGSAGERVHVVATLRDLERAVARLRASGGAWVAQEHVPGATYLFGGLFADGAPLRLYAAEKVELYPPCTGPAIRLRSDGAAQLVELGRRVLAELAWTGLASADFIRGRDGRFTLLEVNPRPWGSLGAARSAGVDVLGPFAELLAGTVPRADLAFAADRDYMVFPRYLRSPSYRTLAGAARALRDLLDHQGREWRHPGFVRHLVVETMRR